MVTRKSCRLAALWVNNAVCSCRSQIWMNGMKEKTREDECLVFFPLQCLRTQAGRGHFCYVDVTCSQHSFVVHEKGKYRKCVQSQKDWHVMGYKIESEYKLIQKAMFFYHYKRKLWYFGFLWKSVPYLDRIKCTWGSWVIPSFAIATLIFISLSILCCENYNTNYPLFR